MAFFRALVPGVKFEKTENGSFRVVMPDKPRQGNEMSYALVLVIANSKKTTITIRSSRYIRNWETGRIIMTSLMTDGSKYYSLGDPNESNGIGISEGWIDLNLEDQDLTGSPMFIILAHELIHAVHASEGTLDKTKDLDGIRRNEEKRTIGDGNVRNGDITENMIRAEHNLPASSVDRNYE